MHAETDALLSVAFVPRVCEQKEKEWHTTLASGNGLNALSLSPSLSLTVSLPSAIMNRPRLPTAAPPLWLLRLQAMMSTEPPPASAPAARLLATTLDRRNPLAHGSAAEATTSTTAGQRILQQQQRPPSERLHGTGSRQQVFSSPDAVGMVIDPRAPFAGPPLQQASASPVTSRSISLSPAHSSKRRLLAYPTTGANYHG